MVLDFIIFSIYFLIYLIYGNYLKNKNLKNDTKRQWVQDRLEELKRKKDKTAEEQLEYINLNNSVSKGININYVFFIKILVLVLLIQIFQSRLLLLGIIMGWMILTRLIKKKGEKFFIGFAKDFSSITAMIIIFTMFKQYNFLLVFLNIFIISFTFNLIRRNLDGKIRTTN